MTTPWKKVWFRALGKKGNGTEQRFTIYRDGVIEIQASGHAEPHRCHPLVQTEEQVLQQIQQVFHVQNVEKLDK
jgi:hypothetical protein